MTLKCSKIVTAALVTLVVFFASACSSTPSEQTTQTPTTVDQNDELLSDGLIDETPEVSFFQIDNGILLMADLEKNDIKAFEENINFFSKKIDVPESQRTCVASWMHQAGFDYFGAEKYRDLYLEWKYEGYPERNILEGLPIIVYEDAVKDALFICGYNKN
jgi:hypothetical protein